MDSSLYYFGLVCLVAILAYLVGRAFFKRSAIFELPVLMGFLGMAWVLPQAFALENMRVNDYATQGFWIYVAACFLFLMFGFRYGQVLFKRRLRRSGEAKLPEYDVRLLHVASLGLAVLGWISFYFLRGVDVSEQGGQWTGQAAALVLLAKTSGLALCLCVLLFTRTRSKVAIAIAILVALPMIQTAFGAVRRELLLDILLLSGGVFAFVTKRYPPRAALVAGVIVGTVILNSVGNLRAYVESGEGTLVEAMTSAETYTSFDFFSGDPEQATEIRQAQFDHWRIGQFGYYQYGAGYWNGLVHLYVPAFILGRDFKESLKIRNNYSVEFGGGRNEVFFSGSTRTGFADSYVNFGPFGVLVFGLIGLIFGYAYANAMMGGLGGQFLYFVMLTDGMKSITHSTAEFFASTVFTALLVYAALVFAKKKRGRRTRVPQAGAGNGRHSPKIRAGS